MEEVFNQNVSKYNEAMLQIQRLHDSWTKCNQYARTGNLRAWNYELDIIWRELSTDVLKVEKEDENKILEIFVEYKPKDIRDLNNSFRNKLSLKKGREFYNILDNRHQFLKLLQEMVGKGGVYTDGYDEDFE